MGNASSMDEISKPKSSMSSDNAPVPYLNSKQLRMTRSSSTIIDRDSRTCQCGGLLKHITRGHKSGLLICSNCCEYSQICNCCGDHYHAQDIVKCHLCEKPFCRDCCGVCSNTDKTTAGTWSIMSNVSAQADGPSSPDSYSAQLDALHFCKQCE